ncbi:hypothetical protein [Desulfobulbus sp.]|uniref:hypothetical protein n=1 Tax=Desulfobulbus sp. TaxID=895 RepID=UPI00286F93CF|nr:hypothetical protein [Desulfobulbus sp.]
MNQIAWLEKNIMDVERLLSSHKAWMDQAPSSFSARLVHAGTESRLAELRQQLYLEKEKRGKEIVELHLEGLQSLPGTIPLRLLSQIAKDFSDAAHAAAYRLRRGKELISRLPNSIVRTLDLRLAGIACGSTKLFISTELRANLYGQSLAENTIESIFEILTAKDGEEMAKAASEAGLKATRSVAKMCATLAKEKVSLGMTWNDPAGNDHIFNGTTEKLDKMSIVLMELASIPPEEIEVEGTLSLIGVKGRFEIEKTGGKTIRGRYPDFLFDKVRDIPIGSLVRSTIRKECIENKTTGYMKDMFFLQDIENISPINNSSGRMILTGGYAIDTDKNETTYPEQLKLPGKLNKPGK